MFTPYLVSAPLRAGTPQGWNRLRRFSQRLAHEGTVTLTLTALRDGSEVSPALTRTRALGEVGPVDGGFAATGTTFQVKIAVTAFSARVVLSDAVAWVVAHRSTR